jgi:hypothetical protein
MLRCAFKKRKTKSERKHYKCFISAQIRFNHAPSPFKDICDVTVFSKIAGIHSKPAFSGVTLK